MIKYIVSLALLGFVLGILKGYMSDNKFLMKSSETQWNFIYILFWILYIVFIIIALKFGWHVLVILHRNW